MILAHALLLAGLLKAVIQLRRLVRYVGRTAGYLGLRNAHPSPCGDFLDPPLVVDYAPHCQIKISLLPINAKTEIAL